MLETDSFELIRRYVLHEGVVGFQIPIALQASTMPTLILREISSRDMPTGHLRLGQLKGRGLFVAMSRLATQPIHALEEVQRGMLAAAQ